LVDRDPIHEHRREAGLSAPEEDRAHRPGGAGAGGGGARDLLEEREERRGGALLDPLPVEDVRAHPEVRGQGLPPGRCHHQAFAHGGGREDEVETSRLCLRSDDDSGGAVEDEPGSVDRCRVAARVEVVHPVSAPGPGGDETGAGRTFDGHGHVGQGEPVVGVNQSFHGTGG
jgi:hypothetical protein